MLNPKETKVFNGVMRITPGDKRCMPYELEGTFVYQPESDCWIHDGRSFSASACQIVMENQ